MSISPDLRPPADDLERPANPRPTRILEAGEALATKFARAVAFVRNRPILRAVLAQDAQVVIRGHLEALHRCRQASAETIRAILRSGADAGVFRNDLDEDEGYVLLDFLASRVNDVSIQCRWHWTRGAVAVWDERATQHSGAADHRGQARALRRCTVAGERPR